MKAMLGSKIWPAAVGATMLLMVSGLALGGTGGTIYFSGAIVEPTFGITAATRGSAQMPNTGVPLWTVEQNEAVSITWLAAPNSEARANVSVIAAGENASGAHASPAPVRVSFTGHVVRRIDADGTGQYTIGDRGGVIRIEPSPSAHPSKWMLLVVTSYQ